MFDIIRLKLMLAPPSHSGCFRLTLQILHSEGSPANQDLASRGQDVVVCHLRMSQRSLKVLVQPRNPDSAGSYRHSVRNDSWSQGCTEKLQRGGQGG